MKFFEKNDSRIGVAAHLARTHDGGLIVDTLVLMDIQGDEELCRALFGDLQQKYVGKPKHVWDT